MFCTDAYDAAAGADVLVIVTEWNEFRALSPERLTQRDARAADHGPAQRVRSGGHRRGGLEYRGIGRPEVALAKA